MRCPQIEEAFQWPRRIERDRGYTGPCRSTSAGPSGAPSRIFGPGIGRWWSRPSLVGLAEARREPGPRVMAESGTPGWPTPVTSGPKRSGPKKIALGGSGPSSYPRLRSKSCLTRGAGDELDDHCGNSVPCLLGGSDRRPRWSSGTGLGPGPADEEGRPPVIGSPSLTRRRKGLSKRRSDSHARRLSPLAVIGARRDERGNWRAPSL